MFVETPLNVELLVLLLPVLLSLFVVLSTGYVGEGSGGGGGISTIMLKV